MFFNEPLLLLDDVKHSVNEARYHALGVTDDQRLLHTTFTLRAKGTRLRIISARDMHRKERKMYVDWSKSNLARFPKLKPTTKTISLRLPESLLDRIKIEANKRDVPYQSLIKAWLADEVNRCHRRP